MTDKSIKSYITVKVSGPGTCFDYEFETIRRALEAAGLEVEVINEFPPEDVEKVFTHRANLLAKGRTLNTKVTLVADHCPWGG